MGGTVRASLSRFFGPCAARVFGRQVPFSQVACATWKDNRLLFLCRPTPRCPSEVSACESMLLLRRHETSGTLALLRLVPSFPGSRRREPYGRSRPEKYSNAASDNGFQCRPVRVVFIRAILSSR